MRIQTEVEHIFRVFVYCPKGHKVKGHSEWIFSHPKCISCQKRKHEGKTFFRIDFLGVAPQDRVKIRKYCRDQLREYYEKYIIMNRKKENNSRQRVSQNGIM